MLEIVLATNNQNKINEYKKILKDLPIKLYSLSDLKIDNDPEETGKTFKENSLIKAKSLQNCTKKIILSDDSGIVIDALGDEFPGIYSKRYALSLGGFEKCNSFLTLNYANSPAKFTCCICVLNLTDDPLYFIGECKGKITNYVTKNNGFGYDPIFLPDGYNKTYGELTSEEKNNISHRKRAILKMIDYLKENNYI